MATYQQWSQSYFPDLTSNQHNVNNQWFQSMRDRLTDSGIYMCLFLTKSSTNLEKKLITRMGNPMLILYSQRVIMNE